MQSKRTNILYLAPWVDFGGTDKGTIDWFRCLDRDRFAASLITTQPSPNRRLSEVVPHADEVWPLPELMAGRDFPRFIADFVESRRVDVVHLMNSRLGFDLLPDLAGLPVPPKVVVQLHVEEADRTGYVRYVATRYGNLVDAFSVTSRHLGEAILDYEVSPAKVEVIPTGVDARREFSPELVAPLAGLEDGPAHVLFLGRLVEQKDPLLMVEVAARLKRRADRPFRLHVVGEGHLRPRLEELVGSRGLEEEVRFHPPAADARPWFAACDLLLMTSTFEGVPYVAYEALAMGVPVVAPALPGNRELMNGDGGMLIDSRDPDEYAAALDRLVSEPQLRDRLGESGRRRVLEDFSLRRMAESHERLYERLLERRDARERRPPVMAEQSFPEPLRFRTRPSLGQPLVTVVVPTHNHARYLEGALRSIEEQTYPSVETIVVDDASTEPDSDRVLAGLETRPGVRVLRLERNSGPSAARNAAIEQARGRYVLPLDADNRLLPGAVEQLVAQLAGAGETVGFVYPNQLFFGNRSDYFQAPEYNLALLLAGNYCDTGSLIDREVFDAGIRYPEDIHFGHEDWDFVLGMAEWDIRGEPARSPTLLVRKHGFSRADRVEHAADAFGSHLFDRHPLLFGRPNPRWAGDRDLDPLIAVRARWAPEVSLVALEPFTGAANEAAALADALHAQTFRDAEVLLRSDGGPDPFPRAPRVRRLPTALGGGTAAGALGEALGATRGRLTIATELPLEELLQDASLVEKVVRSFRGSPDLSAMAFADAGERPVPLRLLDDAEAGAGRAHTLAWRRGAEREAPGTLPLAAAAPLQSLARWLTPVLVTDWRRLAGRPRADPGGPELDVSLAPPEPRTESERSARRASLGLAPVLPGLPDDAIRRWARSGSWTPVETQPLVRHRRSGGEERIVTNSRDAPPGYEIEFDLGSVQVFPKPGTTPLVIDADGTPRLAEAGEVRESFGVAPAEPFDPAGGQGAPRVVGHLEQVAFPMLLALEAATDPETGRPVLVSGADDPLSARVTDRRTLGFIESYPIEPREPPGRDCTLGLTGLLCGVDGRARRHLYATGAPPGGDLVGELGALLTDARPGLVRLYCRADGLVASDAYAPAPGRPARRTAARWTLAPLAWRGRWSPAARLRAVARRALETTRALLRPRRGRAPAGERELGFLLPGEGRERVPLYSSLHPVNGDQLLTRSPHAAASMGYGQTTLLGYLRAVAPVTGELALTRVSVSWASRFGEHRTGD